MTINLHKTTSPNSEKPLKHAVVTGATGLIGRWLLIALTRDGVEVCALLRNAPKRLPALKEWVAQRGGNPELLSAASFDLLHADLGLDPQGRAALARTEAVYHLAAMFDFGLAKEAARSANLDAPLKLVELLAGNTALRRLIHISGYRTEGQPALALDVDDAASVADFYRHHGAYEASKMEAHTLVMRAAAALNLPYTCVSPAVVIGDSQSGETTQYTGLAETLKKLWHGQLPALPGNAQTWLPLVPVDYLATLLARLPLDAASLGKNLLVFDDRSPALPELVRLAASRMDVPAPRWSVPIGLLKRLPQAMIGTHPEALSFLSTDRYDARPLHETNTRLGLSLPPLEQSFTRWVDHLLDTRFGERPTRGGRGFEAAGTRVFGRGDRHQPKHVFLHGVMLNEQSWTPVIDETRASYLAVDLPGLGRSAAGGGTPGEWLRGVLTPAQNKPILVAHSLGGAFALEYAAAHPDRIAGLVLVSPFFLQAKPSLPLRLRWLMRWAFQWLSPKKGAAVLDNPKRGHIDALDLLNRPQVARANAHWLAWASQRSVRTRLRDLLTTVKVPTTLVHGERDPLLSAAPTHCQTVRVAGAGHYPQLSHPIEVASAIG